jgi:hypothetical protein
MKSPKPANDCFRRHHVEELQTCRPRHARDTWHDEIVFWNNQIIIWLFIISTFPDLRNYWTEFHETWWSYRYMFLVGPKVFSFVVKGVKVTFWGFVSIIKHNNFKFSVRYHSVTELEATLLIKYINYFIICLCYLKLTVYSNTISSCQVSLAWRGLQVCSSSTWWRRKQSLAGLGDFIIVRL